MYSSTEFRAHMKQAFNRAIKTPIKVMRNRQVFYLLTEEQFRAMQTRAIVKATTTPPAAEPGVDLSPDWGA